MAEIQSGPAKSQPALGQSPVNFQQVSEVILDHASSSQPSSCPNPVGAKLGVKPMLSHSKAYILNSNMILTSSKCVLFLRTLMRQKLLQHL